MSVTEAFDNTFKDEINNNKAVVVKYYADWCGNCKLFSPKFKRLSNDERFLNIHFIDVNAENSPESRAMGEVKNLPTFATFLNGKLLQSESTSKEEVLVEMLNKLN